MLEFSDEGQFRKSCSGSHKGGEMHPRPFSGQFYAILQLLLWDRRVTWVEMVWAVFQSWQHLEKGGVGVAEMAPFVFRVAWLPFQNLNKDKAHPVSSWPQSQARGPAQNEKAFW